MWLSKIPTSLSCAQGPGEGGLSSAAEVIAEITLLPMVKVVKKINLQTPEVYVQKGDILLYSNNRRGYGFCPGISQIFGGRSLLFILSSWLHFPLS